MTGRYEVALPYETEPPCRTSQPWTRCEWVTSQTRRDLPTPGSPTIATTCPWPLAARPCAWRSWSSSPSRPTKRVNPRAAAPWSRERKGPAAVSS
jgi:hypothetical protein